MEKRIKTIMKHKLTEKHLALISAYLSNIAYLLLSIGETHAEKKIVIKGKELKITFDIKNNNV